MSDEWPYVSPEIKSLIRRGAELILDPPEEWIEAIHDASLGGIRMKAIADDPVLAEELAAPTSRTPCVGRGAT